MAAPGSQPFRSPLLGVVGALVVAGHLLFRFQGQWTWGFLLFTVPVCAFLVLKFVDVYFDRRR